MFINHLIIVITFRLINFIIVLSVGAYLFKKHALPFIYELMTQKESEKELLINEQTFFEQKQHDLNNLIQRDILLCNNLKIKINEWKKVFDQERYVQEKNHLNIIAAF